MARKRGWLYRAAAALTLALAIPAAVLMCSCQRPGDYPDDQPQPAPSQTDASFYEEDNLLTLEALMTRLNDSRRQSDEADYQLEDYLPDYTSPEFAADELNSYEFSLLTTQPGIIPEVLSLEQAKQDTGYLFRVLSTSYGAYQLFGGEESFGAAEQRVLDALETGYPTGITPGALRSLLLGELRFVEDTHFGLDDIGTSFLEKRFFRDGGRLEFRQDGRGYYATADNDPNSERWYISLSDAGWLRVTISESGELVYGLFALADQSSYSQLPAALTLHNLAGETTSYNINWGIMECSYLYEPGYYSYRETEGIPVVSLSSYLLDEITFDDINDYINDAVRLHGEEVIIVDLRYNTGGYDTISGMWLYELTGGADIDNTVGYASYISRLNEYIIDSNAEVSDELFDALDFFDRHPDYWEEDEDEEYNVGDTYMVEPESEFYEYDGTIFVLMNKHTYSAGELALFQFENMSNVVFVGMNSNGCLLTGGTNLMAPVYLPNSGIEVSYSMMLVTSDIMDGFDSYGFQPDIVIDNKDAVEAIIDCWNYYNKE